MPIKPRRYHRRYGNFRRLDGREELKPLDYCSMVRNSSLPDEELARSLGVSERLIQRMRELDYLPKDKELQAKIMEQYLKE